jgi:gamma-glutamylaminecyclotransferase
LRVAKKMSSKMHKVFVYGTLKKNEPNHYWLQEPSNGYAKFLTTAKTIEKYPLIIATRYNIPFLLDCPGKGHVSYSLTL